MVKLSELIAPSFYGVHHLIKNREYVHFWEKGGRGSTKSSFVSVEFILEIEKDPMKHGLALRKYGVNLRDSVFNQLIWAIEKLGLTNEYRRTLSPLQIIKISTGQTIFFRGCDDPTKIKSIKPKFGYIGVGWFEEINEFDGMDEIRNVAQSFVRGGDDFLTFYSYNPPKESSNWVNTECKENVPNRHVHHSTYLEVPPEWIGKQFIQDAEILKEVKIKDYEHEYLGIPNSENDFSVVKGWSDANEVEINYLPDLDLHISCDFNWSPNCWILSHKTDREAYFFKEYCLDLPSGEMIKVILDDFPHDGEIIINGDSSGNFQKSNSELTDYIAIAKELVKRGYVENAKTGKRFRFELRNANGNRKARFNAFNKMVKDDLGQPRIFADPIGCPYFIDNCRNLKVVPGTSNYQLPSQVQIRKEPILRFRGHAFDNGSYHVNTYWPVS